MILNFSAPQMAKYGMNVENGDDKPENEDQTGVDVAQPAADKSAEPRKVKEARP